MDQGGGLSMAAPRKAPADKAVNRWISFQPIISAYLDSLPIGQKSQAVNEAIGASPEFRAWWEAIKEVE